MVTKMGSTLLGCPFISRTRGEKENLETHQKRVERSLFSLLHFISVKCKFVLARWIFFE